MSDENWREYTKDVKPVTKEDMKRMFERLYEAEEERRKNYVPPPSMEEIIQAHDEMVDKGYRFCGWDCGRMLFIKGRGVKAMPPKSSHQKFFDRIRKPTNQPLEGERKKA